MNEFNVGDLVILKSVGFVPKNQMVVSAIFQDLQGKTIVRCLWKNEENDYIAETLKSANGMQLDIITI